MDWDRYQRNLIFDMQHILFSADLDTRLGHGRHGPSQLWGGACPGTAARALARGRPAGTVRRTRAVSGQGRTGSFFIFIFY